MGRFGRRHVDREVVLSLGEAEAPLNLHLASVAVHVLSPEGSAAPRFTFTFTLPLATWFRIDDEGIFSVAFQTTASGQGPVEFRGDRPLDLEVEPVAGLDAGGADEDPEVLLTRALDAFARGERGLGDARSYRWLRVLQETGPAGSGIKGGLASVFAIGPSSGSAPGSSGPSSGSAPGSSGPAAARA
jgi:hypothetical protein